MKINMSDIIDYFDLPAESQKELISLSIEDLNKSPNILEKDIWVCWVLEKIFNMPNYHPMAFKGGTSLSKVFGVIDRFSEDVDITLDFQHFECAEGFDFEKYQLSSRARDKMNINISEEVKKYINEKVFPYLTSCLSEIVSGDNCKLEISESGEQIYLYYTSLFDIGSSTHSYIQNRVMIEFVGRNLILPNEAHEITPYISTLIEKEGGLNIKLPKVKVLVLSPQRTFWEKVTLLHAECGKGIRASAERLSRHWFDLVALWQHDIGQQAVQDRALLTDVVKHKNCFYYAGSANYSDCLEHKFFLIPNGDGLERLSHDYTAMRESGMIPSNAISFEDMMSVITEIQTFLNTPTTNQMLVRELEID